MTQDSFEHENTAPGRRPTSATQGYDYTGIMPGRATLEVMGLAPASKQDGGVVQPETYLTAAGELLALMFAVVWLVSLIFNPGVVHDNPIAANLGYNNFCVGLDTQPAKSPGLILFVACYYVCIRYAITNMQRSFERRRNGKNTRMQFVGSVTTDLFWAISFSVFSLVWVINPWMSLRGHTAPFCFFIICRWATIFARMLESPATTWRGWAWMCVYGPISFILPIYYFSSFSYHDATGGVMIPYWVGMILDYTWFACLPLTGLFLHVDKNDITAMVHIAGAAEADRLENQTSLLDEGDTPHCGPPHIVAGCAYYALLLAALVTIIWVGHVSI